MKKITSIIYVVVLIVFIFLSCCVRGVEAPEHSSVSGGIGLGES